MVWWILGAPVVIVLLWYADRRGWIDLRNRGRSSVGVGALGAIDEVFAPHRHEVENLREIQRELPIESPVAGDPDKGMAHLDDDPDARFGGTITIDVPCP